MHIDVVARDFRKRGLDGLADLIKQSHFVNFAAWRWNTLCDVCRSLKPILDSLIKFFDPKPFLKAKEPAFLAKMLEAFRSAEWRGRFDFVHWLTGWLWDMSQWASGCKCHGPDGAGMACD